MSSPIRIYVTVGLLSVALAAVFFAIPPRYAARREARKAHEAEVKSAWVAQQARDEEARRVAEAFPNGMVDLVAELSKARASAEAVIPNAMLSAFRAKNVSPDGHADLSNDGSVAFEFVAPPNAPRAAPCAIEIRDTWKHGRVQQTTTRCDTPPMPLAPQCTWADIWREVARRKGPSQGLISVGLAVHAETETGQKQVPRPMWDVDVVGGSSLGLIPDSCTH
jgi:hypothetical protein